MQEFIHGAGVVCIYFVVAASTALFSRKLIKIPDELFRKILHFILLFSYLPFAFAFETWWKSVSLALVLEILIYPVLKQAENLPFYSSFTTERKQGELKSSLLLAFTMLAVCNTICWGVFGDKYFGLACMYAWGVGDAFAALVGKRFGRHKITWRYADGKKSIEGSLAMFLTSAISIACVLLAHDHLTLPAYIVIPIAGSAVSTLVEMVTKDGRDTIYCPTAAMLVMLPLMILFGGFA